MNESNGEVIAKDAENARNTTREDMLLAEIGQLERIIEKKEREVEDAEEEVDNASSHLETLQSELAGLRDALDEKNRDLETPDVPDMEEYNDER